MTDVKALERLGRAIYRFADKAVDKSWAGSAHLEDRLKIIRSYERAERVPDRK